MVHDDHDDDDDDDGDGDDDDDDDDDDDGDGGDDDDGDGDDDDIGNENIIICVGSNATVPFSKSGRVCDGGGAGWPRGVMHLMRGI